MGSDIRKRKLVDKYICLTALFHPNNSIQNDIEQLQSLENIGCHLIKRAVPIERPVKKLDWVFQVLKSVKFYFWEAVNTLVYRRLDSHHAISKILDECIETGTVVNLMARQLFEFRKKIGTRVIHGAEEKFLSLCYGTLLSLSKFLESHTNEDIVSGFLKTSCVEKRFSYSTGAVDLNIDRVNIKDDVFALTKYVELLLNLTELTACGNLEFAFRITYGELLRSPYESYCCSKYFLNANAQLFNLKHNISSTWKEYNNFMLTGEKENLRLECEEPISAAVKYTREYKLWKNSIEMKELGAEMMYIFELMAASAKDLVREEQIKTEEVIQSKPDGDVENDCQLHLQALIKNSNLMLSRLARISGVNEEIIDAMLRVKDSGGKVVSNCAANPKVNESLHIPEKVEIDTSVANSIFEHGQDLENSSSKDFNTLEQSEKYEVYQLQERFESDEECDTEGRIYEWEPQANEIKATRNFVMSELKQVLVGVKDVMTKRENEAFVEKYGTELPEQPSVPSICLSSNADHHNINKYAYRDGFQPESTLRKRLLMTDPKNEDNCVESENINRFEQVSDENRINLTLFRPNFAPLQDEYTISGSESENDSENDSK